MSKAESVILAGFFFALYMALFGVSTGNPLSVTNTMNQILSGPPGVGSLMQASKNCGFWDIGCNAANVSIATANVAAAIWYPGILVFWFLNKIGLFFGFIGTAILGPQLGANATPFLSLFWGALLFYVLFEIIRIFRGNSTGV